MLSTTNLSKSQKLLRREPELERCPECGSQELVTDKEQGEVVCSFCGLILTDQIIDQRPEWRAFTLEEKEARSRVGLPTSLSHYDKGLSTTFRPNEDASGGTLPPKTRLEMMRLRRWNIRARMHSSMERNLSQAMSELERLYDKLNIPKSVKEEAALIYRKALKMGLVRGRSIAGIAAASLYAACRLTRTPRRLDDIVKTSTKDKKEISRCYRLIRRELGLRMPIDDPLKYVPKIASKAGLSQKTQNKALEILQKARKRRATVGKDPMGIAAAALYVASIIEGERVTQRELAKASGVTEVTVRNRYKGLAKRLGMRDIYSL